MSDIFSFRRLAFISAVALTGVALAFALIQTAITRFWVEPSTVLLHVFPVLGLWAGLLLPDSLISFCSKLEALFKKHAAVCALVCAFVTLFVLIYINRHILLGFMNSADEHSCYFMAQYLSAGHLWALPHPLKEFFETPHIGAVDGKWFSVYPPGWPLVWALGLKLNMKDTLNPLIMAVSVIWMFRLSRLVYGIGPALFAVLFLLISPFFLLTGAAYYSHNLCFLLMLFFLEAVWRWREENQVRWALAAGLILAGAAATRYLTAAALAFPVLAGMAWETVKQKGRGIKLWIIFSAAFLALNAFHFYYNYLITGNFLDPPNHFLHNHEKLGFIYGYPPSLAFEYMWKRILYLIEWTPPGIVILFLFVILPSKIQGFWDTVFRFNFVFLVLAYMLYYSWGGNQYGPRYLFEGYPFMLISVGAWICMRWQAHDLRIKKCLIGLMIGMTLSALPVLAKQAAFFLGVSSERRAVFVAAETQLSYPALVFIKGFLGKTLLMSEEDAVRNDPFLNTEVIYAHDRGEKNKELAAFFPGRFQYQASYDTQSNQPRLNKINE